MTLAMALSTLVGAIWLAFLSHLEWLIGDGYLSSVGVLCVRDQVRDSLKANVATTVELRRGSAGLKIVGCSIPVEPGSPRVLSV